MSIFKSDNWSKQTLLKQFINWLLPTLFSLEDIRHDMWNIRRQNSDGPQEKNVCLNVEHEKMDLVAVKQLDHY